MEKILSPKFSLKGWSFWSWIKGQAFFWEWFESSKKLLKEISKYLISGTISFITIQKPEFATLATFAGKALLDILDYYLKEQTKK